MGINSVDKKLKMYLVEFAFIIFSILILGLFIFLTNPDQAVGFTLAYVAGLSMIFLPWADLTGSHYLFA